MVAPSFYNALYRINYRLPNVTLMLHNRSSWYLFRSTHCKTAWGATIILPSIPCHFRSIIKTSQLVTFTAQFNGQSSFSLKSHVVGYMAYYIKALCHGTRISVFFAVFTLKVLYDLADFGIAWSNYITWMPSSFLARFFDSAATHGSLLRRLGLSFLQFLLLISGFLFQGHIILIHIFHLFLFCLQWLLLSSFSPRHVANK